MEKENKKVEQQNSGDFSNGVIYYYIDKPLSIQEKADTTYFIRLFTNMLKNPEKLSDAEINTIKEALPRLERYLVGEADSMDMLYLSNIAGLRDTSYIQKDIGLKERVSSQEGFCDMHNHSTNSDGLLTPTEIIYFSKLLGMDRVVVSDHDCIDAYLDEEFLETARDLGVQVIPAVELVSAYKDVGIEILGYGVDVEKMKEYLDGPNGDGEGGHGVTQNALERYRSEMIPKVFAQNGFELDYDPSTIDFTKKDPLVLRTIYNKLVEEKQKNPDSPVIKFLEDENPKMLDSIDEFLRAGLNNPKSKIFINPTSFYPQFDKITKVIHDMGGIAILAHPYQYKKEMDRVLEGVKNYVDGIECYHPSSREPEKNQYLLDFAHKHGLMVTGGSDCHNLNPTGDKSLFTRLKIPAECFDNMVEAIAAKEKPERE